jgi:hypothetical protein
MGNGEMGMGNGNWELRSIPVTSESSLSAIVPLALNITPWENPDVVKSVFRSGSFPHSTAYISAL